MTTPEKWRIVEEARRFEMQGDFEGWDNKNRTRFYRALKTFSVELDGVVHTFASGDKFRVETVCSKRCEVVCHFAWKDGDPLGLVASCYEFSDDEVELTGTVEHDNLD